MNSRRTTILVLLVIVALFATMFAGSMVFATTGTSISDADSTFLGPKCSEDDDCGPGFCFNGRCEFDNASLAL